MKNQNFFAMLSRMKYINRWGLMRNTVRENIAEHCLDTAIIAHALAVIRNTCFEGAIDADRVAVLAMFHDAAEIITGDLPTPVKYFAPEIRQAYKKVEKAAENQLIQSLPDNMQDTYLSILSESPKDMELWELVKAADKLSALVKCIEEKRMGNQDFEKAERTLQDTLIKMNIPEVEYFMQQFLPAYSLTLDEQA